MHILAVGDFGLAVAAAMAERLDVAITVVNGKQVFPARWPLARLHVLASWRPVLSISQEVEMSSFAWRVPWLPIIAEHPYIYIGPSVVPGAGACYRCFRQRLMQHSSSADLSDALQAHYESVWEAGTRGYLPTMACFCAMIACDVAESLARDATGEAGAVRQIHVTSLRTLRGAVIGVNGCEQCGQGRDERTRSHAELEKELPQLLKTHP